MHLVMPLVARGDLKAIMATGDADCWGLGNAGGSCGRFRLSLIT